MRKVLSALRSHAVEASAFARQAWLLPRDTLAPVVPRHVHPGEDVVVFVHGLFASAGVLRPMRQAVTRHRGIHDAAMSYAPGPGAEALVERLASLLEPVPDGARVHLVGHSLGGIVARLYAVTRDDPRVAQTIALASPFGGVPAAAALGFDGARDLAPGSAVLRTLRIARPSRAIPHLSIVAGDDVLHRSPIAHVLPTGEHLVLEGRGHNAVLFDREAIRLVERRVLEVRAELRRAGDHEATPAEPPRADATR
jgi:pimeloyl-ACP methyl ester carboxylesterase